MMENVNLLSNVSSPNTLGVLVIDTKKQIVFADERVSKLLNKTQSELIGKSCSEFKSVFPCGEESCSLNEPCRLFTKADPNDTIVRINEHCGFNSHPVTDRNGNNLGVVHVVTLTPGKFSSQRKKEEEFYGIVGKNKKMQELYSLIELVAPTDVSVHIFGQSGTGKELIADALHALSDRHSKRLVKVNCSTIPETLLESALFGHIKGSFTGANKDHEGFVEYAEGGTLFLDEIGDVSTEIQVKLLRLLQSREYNRVGDSRTRSADLRIITATNKNLIDLVKAGSMREDFFYRINVFPISVPTLSERIDDVELLSEHFINRFNKRFNKNLLGLSRESLSQFKQYNWPGNVRELEHAIEHAFVKASTGLIEVSHLPGWLSLSEPRSELPVQDNSRTTINPMFNYDSKEGIERALNYFRRNVSKAAENMGISRVTLWKYMKKFEIER